MSTTSSEDSFLCLFTNPKRHQQLLELVRSLFPQQKHVVEHMNGGAFNFVVKIKCGSKQYILRTPRLTSKEIDYDTTGAMLIMLSNTSWLSIPTPRLCGLGESHGFRWMLMNCLPGINLTREIYDQLPSQQACFIAKQIAHVIYELSQIRFQTCGSLVKGPNDLVVGRAFLDQHYEWKHVYEEQHCAPSSLVSFLLDRFQSMIADAERNIKVSIVFFFLVCTSLFFFFFLKKKQKIPIFYV